SIRDTTHTWAEGRCASYGRSAAFLPLVDMWRRSLAIEDHDDERDAIAKVDGGIAEMGSDLAWTAPYVRRLLSLPDDDPAIEAGDANGHSAETFRAPEPIPQSAGERD